MGDALDFCDKVGDNLSELGKWWRVWQNIILGQFLSLILCALNTLSHYINSSTSSVLPTGQSFPHYMFLCAIYTSWLAFRRGDKGLISIIKARGWRYLLLCLIDVQANTLLSTAHQFTTLTSIQLLGCVAIPVALALSCLVLGVRYRMVHIIAVSVCLMGVGCLVWANIEDTKIDGKNQLVGDMLCLGGAVLFAIVTVLQELSVKNTDIIEYLGLLGLFGSIVSGIQIYKFHALYFLSYTLSMTGVYIYAIKQTPVATQNLPSNRTSEMNNSRGSECQLPEHMITDSPERLNNEILSAFGTLNSNDTFPLSHSTNTTFTSFYGSHDIINSQTTSA
ncbi:hypothetical protein NQ318_021451 [Aromia moschata]|uniref:Solute carrier family 35 member F1 n=1 Tax=Aromia moschata TaxID=1265417 RepID=A0AAV8ZCM1_9CUCU|nr:hypothetical protein NQ318_021451 [Aromia moschata]